MRVKKKQSSPRFITRRSVPLAAGAVVLGVIAGIGTTVWNTHAHLYAEAATANSIGAVAASGGGLHPKASAPKTAGATSTPKTNRSAPATSSSSLTSTASSTGYTINTVAQSNLKGLSLYVDPTRASLQSPLNTTPVANWLSDWSGDIRTATDHIVTAAAAQGTVATLVTYNIPQRDCGSYSAGGVADGTGYQAWIRSLAAGIGARKAIVILEPDALAQITCLDSAGQAARYALLKDAVSVLSSQTNAFVYLDAGHSNWVGATDMAARLQKAGVANATGFSLNVSNFETTANNVTYGNALSALVGGKHFVIDTSRNGNGPGDTWCNPSGRALGESPSVATSGNIDAYLWVKAPGESDGTCGGGPSAGTYWQAYAAGLIAQRH